MGSSTNTPLLPEPGKRNILITSALPYCNNVPHLGNIIGSVLSADCFARFCRARGLNTLYICGSDEYGTASATKALEENTTPAELCSKYHEIHKRIYDDFSISFDIYGRTSTEQHTQIVQSIFTKLWENGFIEERTTTQPYCPVHHSFLADRFVEGTCSLCGYEEARGDQCDKCGKLLDPFEQIVKANDKAGQGLKETGQENKKNEENEGEGTGFLKNPYCKLDRATPEARSTKHLYLRLDLLKDQLEEWYEPIKDQWSNTGVMITKDWLKKLHERSITRDLKWGVPIPKGLKGLSDEAYDDKVFYVWFDACIGYPSITKAYTDGDDLSGSNWEKWWKNPKDVTLYQFMGKDNTSFHSIVFPGSQIGTGEEWTKVSRLSTTEYLNYERTKFSKSRNIGVFGTAVKDTGVDTDVWRYYLLRRRPETADSEFLWEDFISVNNELLNNLGNLCNRVLMYCLLPPKQAEKKTEETTEEKPEEQPAVSEKTIDEVLEEHKKDINNELQLYLSHMEGLSLRGGAEDIIAISNLGNAFWHHNIVKNQKRPEEERKAIIDLVLNLIHLLANLLCPYMPNTASSILTQLGVPKEKQTFSIPDIWTGDTLKPGHKLGTPTPLFSRIPARRVEEWKEAFGGDELRKKKAEQAAKVAAKKAAKQKKKEGQNAKKAAVDSGAPST
ncbi:methionyl-tRNA synthetase-like protein [Xylaria acuta]|nr:methionyl-tRNA synthetase-like protein [Xylaria acuta]